MEKNKEFRGHTPETHKLVSSKGGLALNPNRSLSPAQVKEIRNSDKSLTYLTEKYQLSRSMLSLIRNNKRYKDIQ